MEQTGGEKVAELTYRHEWKHIINASDMIAIRQRLRAVARTDANAAEGKYVIRSIYFDNLSDRALREKLDGVSRREKFRMRYYNGDLSEILLEKKSKQSGLGTKERVLLSAAEAQQIIDGDTEWMLHSGRALVQELYVKMKTGGLRPRTIVDYTREPFVYAAGNVRVTLDYDIRTGLCGTDFLDPDCVMIPAADAQTILEVKWDAYLPDVIRDAVQLRSRMPSAYSKYAACRMYD